MSARLRTALAWAAFAVAVVLATAPVWRLAVSGFDPSLDDALLFLCGGK
jgi:hypothetical protein